jgi:hypothetical protein
MSATYAPATTTERRTSLSRGPALIVGTILLAVGLYFMYRQHTYPRWSNFPNGGAPVDRTVWGIFGINGFTGLFTAVCGGLLLFGAAEHFLSKTMSLIVGCALGAAAIIGVISGNVLGLAASNGWTELGWGIAAAILLINALIPARRRVVGEPGAAATGATAGAAGTAATRRRRTAPVAAEEPVVEPAGTGTAGTAGTAAGTGAAAGTGVAAGTAAGGRTSAGNATTTDPAAGTTGMPASGDRAAEYERTHRITGGPAPAEDGTGHPATVGSGNQAATPAEQEAADRQSGGGRLSWLPGRKS